MMESVKAVKSGVAKEEGSIEDKLQERPREMFQEDGSVAYVIHKTLVTDTLDGISIRYNVRKDLIQRVNEFTGDEIYMKKELIIPYTSKK
jgi:LysM repeat protein